MRPGLETEYSVIPDEQTLSVEVAQPTKADKPNVLPYLALAFGLLTLGSSGILVKWANAPGTVNGFYRMAIAAAVVAIPFASGVRREKPLSRWHVGMAILAGLFFAGDLTTWNTAVLITSAANATLFGNTSPLWVSLGALIFFRERLRPAFWGGMLLAMGGAAVILGGDFVTHPTLGFGDLLGLVAGFFYGMFFLAAERARDRLSSLTAWWISAASSAVALFVLTLVFQQPLFGYPESTYINIVALALITQIAGWLAINYALGHLRASLVAPTLLGQPVLTALFAVPLLDQPITVIQVIGGILVLGGILIVHRTKS